MVDNQAMSADIEQFLWQRSAACNGVPSYIFFPDERLNNNFKEAEGFEGKTAEDFCGGCIVRNICKEFALLHNAWGIWGGTNKGSRDRLFSQGERNEMRAFKADDGRYSALYGENDAPDVDEYIFEQAG